MSIFKNRLSVGIVATLVLLLAQSLVHAQTQPTTRPFRGSIVNREQTKAADAVRSLFRVVSNGASRATVSVHSDGKEAALGTVVASDGWILTKASELGTRVTCVLHDGRELPAQVVGMAEDYDLAMLKVHAVGLTATTFTDLKDLQVGQWVATTGTGELPIAVGVVSVTRRRIMGTGLLGVLLADTPGLVKVVQVVRDSGAEKAGITVDDVFVSIDGKPVTTREDLTDAIQSHRLGDSVKIVLMRGEKQLEVLATVGKREEGPPTRNDRMNTMGGPISARKTGFPAVIQHDTVLKPNECGGPVVTLDGKVIGLNIARGGRVESYAIPSDVINSLMPDLKSGKLAPRNQDGGSPTTRPLAGATTRPTGRG